jgi:hypothetical protein
MRLDLNERDIIIITGCNAVGKTTASNFLRKWANRHKIPYENDFISDSQCLFEAMQRDDQTGGLHHTHDWCAIDTQGHSHDRNQPVFPFTVIDNELPNKMRSEFFTNLTKLPKNGKLWFVEWAAGVNTNPRNDPTFSIDYSYATINSGLQAGHLSKSWLIRAKAILHLLADNHIRCELNKKRPAPSSVHIKTLEKGTAFWQKDEKVLRFYGSDDFSEVELLLKEACIPIHTVINDGGSSFYKYLETVANSLLFFLNLNI